jgi:hypothetical protein
MKKRRERDPVLHLIDAVLGDLAVRSAMHVGRRAGDGDAETFVIQMGEEGRLRVTLPDLASDASIEATVAAAQTQLHVVLGAPVPLCPRHSHALVGIASQGHLSWVCPNGEWRCRVGDYAELTWPQSDVDSLAPILAGRLRRRGISGVTTIGVRQGEHGPVADFGVREMSADLVQALSDAAAPLPTDLHLDTRRPIRIAH